MNSCSSIDTSGSSTGIIIEPEAYRRSRRYPHGSRRSPENAALNASTSTAFEFTGLRIDDDGFQDSDYNPGLDGFAYQKGRLTVAAGDGSELSLDAANGDPTTYDLTVRSGGRSETLRIGGVELTRRTGCGAG